MGAIHRDGPHFSIPCLVVRDARRSRAPHHEGPRPHPGV